MSDEELLERIKLDQGYLLAHGRHVQVDDIRNLCERYTRLKAEADRIESENRIITQRLYELRQEYNDVIAEREAATK